MRFMEFGVLGLFLLFFRLVFILAFAAFVLFLLLLIFAFAALLVFILQMQFDSHQKKKSFYKTRNYTK